MVRLNLVYQVFFVTNFELVTRMNQIGLFNFFFVNYFKNSYLSTVNNNENLIKILFNSIQFLFRKFKLFENYRSTKKINYSKITYPPKKTTGMNIFENSTQFILYLDHLGWIIQIIRNLGLFYNYGK